jgi:hypothetical protein
MVLGDANTLRSASGIRSTARVPSQLLRSPERTVEIVKKPVAGDTTLLVREAKYANLPPKPCTEATCYYEWYGSPFDAYPPLGVTPIAFSGDENTTDQETTPPKLTDKFHRCHRKHNVWELDPKAAASSFSLVLVHGPGVGTNWNADFDYVRVIHMKKNPAYVLGSGLPTHINGETAAAGYSIVQCWPGTKQTDWQYFLSTNQGFPPVVSANAVYFKTAMIGGVEYITPDSFTEAGFPQAGTVAGDC